MVHVIHGVSFSEHGSFHVLRKIGKWEIMMSAPRRTFDMSGSWVRIQNTTTPMSRENSTTSPPSGRRHEPRNNMCTNVAKTATAHIMGKNSFTQSCARDRK